jgi:hypothetical protein
LPFAVVVFVAVGVDLFAITWTVRSGCCTVVVRAPVYGE